MGSGASAETPKTVVLNSGYEMPTQGLGTYALDYATCISSIHALAAAGGRLIDTAYMYHNEDAVGEGVRTCSVPREELFVTTKLYPSQFTNPESAIEEALAKLDIGYVDLMLLHHPGEGDVEAYRAMERAIYMASRSLRKRWRASPRSTGQRNTTGTRRAFLWTPMGLESV